MNPQVLQGLQAVATSPLARGAVRYWWLSLPLAYIGWHYWRKRSSEGRASLPQLVGDLAPAASVVISLIALNETLRRSETRASPLQARAKDATFTQQVPNAQAIPSAE